ncbi:MAG: hypothetical protein ABI364_00330 [Caldimonas sp.]
MPEPSLDEESARLHRRFGALGNNRAWELSLRHRTPAEDEEMLQAGYASAWHWRQVGTELNRMRGAMLLAEIHALLGHGTQAWTHAEQIRDYFLRTGAADWEIALVHAIHAHAAAASGRKTEHRDSYERAAQALAAVASEKDRSIVASTFAQVPKP